MRLTLFTQFILLTMLGAALVAVAITAATTHWLGAAAGMIVLLLVVLPLGQRVSRNLSRRAEENESLVKELERSSAELGRALEEASAARERLALLAAAVEASAETILIVDVEGRIQYANPAARAMYGYDPGELAGQNVRIFQPPGRRPLADDILRASAEGVWQGEVNVLRKDGSELPVHLTASVVRDEAGETGGTVALLHDLSAEHQRQEELIQARSQATAFQRGESMKTELISIVSHELRTPLTALQGFSELLLTRSSSADEARLWATTINEEAKRLAKILDGLLSVSRIEAGTIQLKLAPIPVDEVVREIVRSFAEQDSEHRFAVDVSEATPLVSADRERLKQILDNLLSNAVKFTPGGGQIRVAISARDDAAVVSVADQGPGIPSAELPNLFTRFHRAAGPDRTPARGTGLGLYITQQLVALHGGSVSVESEVGRGSTFTFTLPLASPKAQAVAGVR